MSNRSVMVFHAPNELYEQTKDIAEKEMISVSAFCRMAVKNLVKDYWTTDKSSANHTQNTS